MKSVLRSIKPYWFYLICEGKKPIEVGKTAPTAEYWDKITYLYCSKDMKSFNLIPKEHREKYRKYLGKVGAMFVCDKVNIYEANDRGWYIYPQDEVCMWADEIAGYGKSKPLYGWHISDLKIYDKPKELVKFRKPCKRNYDCENPIMCEYLEYDALYNGALNCSCIRPGITRPPQSWQYVEELEE